MEKNMELMDWKGIETGAEAQIRSGRIQITVGTIVLKEAERMIKLFGGDTNAQIEKEEEKKMKVVDKTKGVINKSV